MAEKSIVIIGAGIAGLSAGCYGQMNGYRTCIFEMHNKPGGLCTAWKRKDYTIFPPGYLMGSAPANVDYHRFWQELGAVQDRAFVDYEEFTRIEGRDGQVFRMHADIDRLEQHMREVAPEDGEVVAEFVQVLRAYSQFPMPVDVPPELSGPPPAVEMPPLMMKWMGMSVRDMAEQFQSPILREGLPFTFFGPDSSIVPLLSGLSLMHQKAAGYPVGGFLELARAIEQRYLDLGGEIQYRSPVAKVLVENDRAVGVRLADGTEHRAEIVISAADGHTTIFDWLEAKYVSDEIRGLYDTLPRYPPIFFISLGVDRPFEEMPPIAAGDVFPLAEPVSIGGREHKWLTTHICNFDPQVTPEGRALVKVLLDADYDYWKDLRERDRKRYRAEKDQVADQVIELLDRRYPGLAAQVEMRDVATPATFERYTGNWRGSWMGWVSEPRTLRMRVSKTLPGLDSFYMAGTWTFNGSLPGAATSGRHVAQVVCHHDGKSFVTMVP